MVNLCSKTSTQSIQWNVFILSYDIKFIVFLKSPSKIYACHSPLCAHYKKCISIKFIGSPQMHCAMPCIVGGLEEMLKVILEK
jgi:hypothetical protein